MLTGELARIYTALATLSDKCNPPVRAFCRFPELMPAGAAEATGLFITHNRGKVKPRILVARPNCPDPRLLPEYASLDELISLAHERGHEASWRAGTHVPDSMPEEHRAWVMAVDLLRGLGFSDEWSDEWTAFDEAKRVSLEEHQRRGTPKSEVGADTVRDLAAAMHHLRASERWDLVVDKLQQARLALGEERCRWVYEAERFRLSFGVV